MNPELTRLVWRRAGGRCEYCRLSQAEYPLPLHVDHIIARQHGGKSEPENLALACLHCNRHKGPNIAGRDPATDELVRLFHPRTDVWSEHFEWYGAQVAGKTALGRVTIQVLAMNDADFLALRQARQEERDA